MAEKIVALAIKTIRPRIKGATLKMADIVQIAAARRGERGEIETFCSCVNPTIKEYPTNVSYDAGTDQEAVNAETRGFEEVFNELVAWAGGMHTKGISIAVFTKPDFDVLQNMDSRNGLSIVHQFFYNRLIALFDEFPRQFNVTANKKLTQKATYEAFGRAAPYPEDIVSVTEDAVNTLGIAEIMPRHFEFEAYSRMEPFITRTEAWRKKKGFDATPFDQKVRIDLNSARAVVSIKTVSDENGEQYIAQVAAVRLVEGSILPVQEFIRYIRPRGVDLSNVEADEGLDLAEVEKETRDYVEVMTELTAWFNEAKSTRVFMWDEEVYEAIAEEDERNGTNFAENYRGDVSIDEINITELYHAASKNSVGDTFEEILTAISERGGKVTLQALDTHDLLSECYAHFDVLQHVLSRRGGVRGPKRAENPKNAEESARRKVSNAVEMSELPKEFYKGHLSSLQPKSMTGAPSAAYFLSYPQTRCFECPICSSDMVVPYWYFKGDIRSDLPFGARIMAIGETGCKRHGRFLAGAKVERAENGKIVGTVSLLDYSPKIHAWLRHSQEEWAKNQG